MSRRFSIRVDIDTVKGLVDGVPPLLDFCDDFGVKATFFASVGTDTAGRAFFSSPRPRRHLAVNPVRKYGIGEIMGSLRGLKFSDHGGVFREIEQRGHEVQLHCFNHQDWVRRITGASELEARSLIQQGIDGFKEIFGRPPTAFASPGFMVTDAVLDAEEGLDLQYAGDYQVEGDCVPFTDGRSVVQIPVNAPLIEDLVARGMRDNAIISTVSRVIEENSLTVMYLHPSYEPRMKPHVLKAIIGRALDSAQSATLGEVFEKWSPSE